MAQSQKTTAALLKELARSPVDALLVFLLMLVTIVAYGAAAFHFAYLAAGMPEYYVAMHGHDPVAAAWVSSFALPLLWAGAEVMRYATIKAMTWSLA